MTSFFRKLRWLMRRPGKEAELQEELQFHLEEEAGERQALIGSAATLATAAILAGYLPARNASRIDPMIALRHA